MKTYSPEQVAKQLAFFNYLYKLKAHQGKWNCERKLLPKKYQPLVEQLVSQGILERHYHTPKTWTGKQKICYLQLVTRTPATEIEYLLKQLPAVAPGPKKAVKTKVVAAPVFIPGNFFTYPDEATRLADKRAREQAGIFI